MAAIVILGTLLVSALIARGRYLHQAAQAAEKRRAVDAADSMLAMWSGDPAMPAVDGGGPVPGDPTLAWRTRLLNPADVGQLGARVLRLEIWPVHQELARQSVAANGPAPVPKPLASVELVVPREASAKASLAAHGGGRSQ